MNTATPFARHQRDAGMLNFAAHCRHPLPDAVYDAEDAARRLAARGPRALASHAVEYWLPRARTSIGRELGIPTRGISWAPSADALMWPWLGGEPTSMLCATPISPSLRPILGAATASGRLRIEYVPLEPVRSFDARWSVALRRERYDWALLPHGCERTGALPGSFTSLAGAALDSGAQVIAVLSATFMGMPIDTARLQAVHGLCVSPAYTQSGGGFAFGWHPQAEGTLHPDADVVALARFCAALDWLDVAGWSPEIVHAHIGALQARFLARLDARRLPLSSADLTPVAGTARTNLLCFACEDAEAVAETLLTRDVVVDADEAYLRLGFGMHLGAGEIDVLLGHLADVL